ncbi:MAG: ATP-binding cassette domain-containing protein, partial [Oscillospiraceae bacterium]|nr:ATP-binding cassette domain-containing protein [Oscillospiraceae bacterium]
MPVREIRKKTDELLSFVGLDDFRRRRVRDLSGGMKRRLMICRALLTDPEIILLDEPTAGMDAIARRQTWGILRELQKRNITMLLTTHYMEEAETLCERVALIDSGKLSTVNTPAGLIDELGKFAVDKTVDGEIESSFFSDRQEAIDYLKSRGEIYKVQLVVDLPQDAMISFYKQGEFVDLCAGPHALYTKAVKAFKITSLAGAYWRGSEKNKMLSRIYGTAFQDKEKLDEYLKMLEEVKKRDHRRLGRELGLFMLLDEGPGFPFFLPKGMILKNTLIDYWRQIHQRENYLEISTPLIMRKELWEQSGHWDHYKDNMYTTSIEDEDFCIKPMNCPGGVLVYKSEPRSYKDLPVKLAELGVVHRHERSGTLHGLMRVRCFTQDDA